MTKRVNNKKFLNRCFWNVHGKGKKEKRPRTLIGTNWSLIGKLFHQLGHWLHKHARGRVRHAFLNKLHLKAASQVFNPGGGSPNCGHFGANRFADAQAIYSTIVAFAALKNDGQGPEDCEQGHTAQSKPLMQTVARTARHSSRDVQTMC